MTTTRASGVEALCMGAGSWIRSVPFGSWISSAATGSRSARPLLPSRGKLEQEFFAGLAKHLPGQKKGREKA